VTLNPSVTDVLSELIGANWGKIENLGDLNYRDLLRETRTAVALNEQRPRQSPSWFARLIRIEMIIAPWIDAAAYSRGGCGAIGQVYRT
jgi:hypothetical protein